MKVTVILSAERKGYSPEFNQERTWSMWKELQQMDFEAVECDGWYEGCVEDSFAIPTDSTHIETLHELANDYDQSCILVIEQETKKCYFIYNDASVEEAGTWCKVSKKEAYESVGYSYFPAAGVYYTIKE